MEFTRRMAKKLDIITAYNEKEKEILQSTSKAVSLSELKDPKFQEFLDDLVYTAKNHKMPQGWMTAGLAAIQVNNPVRVFVALDDDTREFMIFINPEIEYISTIQDVDLESCLSEPEDEGMVRRYRKVKVTYMDRHGNLKKEKFSGWNARVIQHEYDHLEGILFTTKITLQ